MVLSLQAAPAFIQPTKIRPMLGRTSLSQLKPPQLSKASGLDQAGSTKIAGGGVALVVAGDIFCRKTTDSVQDEDRFSRRDVLKCFGTIIGMEMIASSGSFTEKSYAADLIQRRQRSEFLSSIKGTLYTAIKDNPDLLPSILTLALNDAMTYDKHNRQQRKPSCPLQSANVAEMKRKGTYYILHMVLMVSGACLTDNLDCLILKNRIQMGGSCSGTEHPSKK